MKDAKKIAGFRIMRPEIGRALGANTMWVYAELVNIGEMHENQDGWFYATREMLEAVTALSRTAIQAAIDKLQAAELIMVDIRGAFYRKHFRLAPLTADILASLSAEQVAQNMPVKVHKKSQLTGTKNASQVVQIVPVNWNEKSTLTGTNCANSNIDRIERDRNKEIENPISKEKIARSRAASSSKKNEKNEELEKIAAACVENLNNLTGRKFEIKEHNTKLYKRLLVKGAIFEDIRLVHEFKCWEWLNNEKMKIYLRPKTITADDNFWGYLDMAKQARQNPTIVRPAAQMTLDEKNHFQFQSTVAEMLARMEREGKQIR
jgi:uncharacterized phage protein (TIGR02220 family)